MLDGRGGVNKPKVHEGVDELKSLGIPDLNRG